MQEIWKPIKDYEGLYEISNLGRVKSLEKTIYFDTRNQHQKYKGIREYKERILKTKPNSCGYQQVTLCKNNKKSQKLVHIMLAEAFIPNLENKPQVNHIDGNKANNDLDNLEWVTNTENLQKASDIGLFSKSKKVNQYDLQGNFIKTFNSIGSAVRESKITNLSMILQGKRKNNSNYIWRYVNE